MFSSTQALAERPAMAERSESFESEVVDISTDLEEVPVFEEMPVFKKMPAQESRPAMDDTSSLDEPQAMENRPSSNVDIAPNTSINNNKTEIMGDVIELKAGDTLPVNVMDFPHRGMSMDKVKNELGSALSTSGPVGDPPITTWTYNDRIVYFEHTHVIHVVAAH